MPDMSQTRPMEYAIPLPLPLFQLGEPKELQKDLRKELFQQQC